MDTVVYADKQRIFRSELRMRMLISSLFAYGIRAFSPTLRINGETAEAAISQDKRRIQIDRFLFLQKVYIMNAETLLMSTYNIFCVEKIRNLTIFLVVSFVLQCI